MGIKKNERIRRPRKNAGAGSGAHNRSTAQNVELGSKGGRTRTEKTALRGFASFDPEKLKEVTKKGGKNRWQQPE